MIKIFNKQIYLLLVCLGFLVPSMVFGSNIYIDTNQTDLHVGDTIIFNVRVDSQAKQINTVEGSVRLEYPSKSASVTDISLAESSFSLWPRKPSLSLDQKNISLVGGIPGGLNAKDAIIFKIVLNLEKTGSITLRPIDFLVYLNDGRGTKDIVKVKDLTINVLPKVVGGTPINEWADFVAKDRNAPVPFQVLFGQDGSVFDGKKFLSFNTIDKESDIKYYEVTEGDLPPVRSGNTYILQQQDKLNKVVVVAYDSALNARQSVYIPKTKNNPYIGLLIIVLVLILAFLRRKKDVCANK
jgi:hypothetical protein